MKPKVPSLTTERLILRPANIKDAEEYSKIGISTYSSGKINTLEKARKYIKNFIKDEDSIEILILLKENKEPIGHIELCHMSWWNNTAIEICYHLKKEHWGKGYATEASRKIIDFCFKKLKFRKIYADTDPNNLASQRVLEKLGFKLEGTIRERNLVNGKWLDELDYGLLKMEWK